jgi:hypothetical protein
VKAFERYTGFGSGTINDYERCKNRIKKDKDLETFGDTLYRELRKHKTKKEFIVYKGIKTSLFKSLIKVSQNADLEALYNDKENSIIGKVIHDKGFISTAVLKGARLKRKIVLRIRIPKRTEGAYIDEISLMPFETEFLINRDQKMLIRNMYKVDRKFFTSEHYVVECDLLRK